MDGDGAGLIYVFLSDRVKLWLAGVEELVDNQAGRRHIPGVGFDFSA